MKYLLSILIITFFLGSCSKENDIDKVKNETESYLLEQLKDPSSYQKISIEILDSVSKLKSIENNFSLYDDDMIDIGSATIGERDSVLALIKNLKANPDLDSLEYIKFLFKYRAKNSFGALDTQESIIKYYPRKPLKDCCVIF